MAAPSGLIGTLIQDREEGESHKRRKEQGPSSRKCPGQRDPPASSPSETPLRPSPHGLLLCLREPSALGTAVGTGPRPPAAGAADHSRRPRLCCGCLLSRMPCGTPTEGKGHEARVQRAGGRQRRGLVCPEGGSLASTREQSLWGGRPGTPATFLQEKCRSPGARSGQETGHTAAIHRGPGGAERGALFT